MYKPGNMSQYQAYAAAALTVGKVRQVVMLYDGTIRLIQQAIDAIKQQDFETRYNTIAKATEIVSGLQNSLDFEQGGDVSKILYDYYASIDARLFTVHRSNSIVMCEQIIKELKMMRNAWDSIDKGRSEAVAPLPDPAHAMSVEARVSVGVSA